MSVVFIVQLAECECGQEPAHCNVAARVIAIEATEQENAVIVALRDACMTKLKELFPNGAAFDDYPAHPGTLKH